MKTLKATLTAMLLLAQLQAKAEDIDLFVTGATTSNSALPNVLFLIDNTANWNTAFTNEMAALINTFNNMPDNKFNVGIMLATESGTGNTNTQGAYVRAAIRTMAGSTKTTYANMIGSLDKLADKGNAGKSGLEMAEAYYYFAGLAPYAGNGKLKTDYTGNTYSGTTAASRAVYALGQNALPSLNGSPYNSPVVSGSCAKNYIIYISNGPNQESSSDDTLANTMLAAAGGSTTTIPISPSGSQSNPSDEWARFMYKSPLQVATFTIDVNPSTSGQGPGWTALLKSMASVSNGDYTAVSSSSGSAAIQKAITDALSKIQSVNTVFAAVSLPASATTQGAYLNQIYVGMFRPDVNDLPRWFGNLKQYKLGTNLNLIDADGTDAINTQTGFIQECARSYWTPTTVDSYWAAMPKGACLSVANSDASNYPDGNIVEKGAQGYVSRGSSPGSRVVKTCSASIASCTSLVDFNTTSVSVAALGAADATEQANLINWAKGQNTEGELGMTTSVMRASVHGDVVHSNPVAVTYGSNVVVFYGSNDGMLRAINGNQTASIGSTPPGAELWSFMPPEFYPQIKRIHDNTVLVQTATISGSPKPYGIDGPLSAYYKDASNTWLFAPMRRGGRSIYAFNVPSENSVSLMWRTGCPNQGTDDGCVTNLSGIGQTWSTPQPVWTVGYTSNPVIIIGGGYDTCEDADPNTCSATGYTPKGKSIFVFDARTGALLKTFSTLRSVVGDIGYAGNVDGKAIYAYAADLGGNIYRITIGSNAPADWTMTQVAALGCDSGSTCSDNRKFMFGPSVVPNTDGSYSLLLGSGDREKPLRSYAHALGVQNYFFEVIDNPTAASWLTSESGTCGNPVICMGSLVSQGNTGATCGGVQTSPSTNKGWKLGLRAGEQTVTQAATRFSVTTFSTHIPAQAQANTCTSNLGTTHVYNLNIDTASAITGTSCNDVVAGGGLPPPPKKFDVCLSGDCSNSSQVVHSCIGCDPNSPIQGKSDNAPNLSGSSQPFHKLYWFIEQMQP